MSAASPETGVSRGAVLAGGAAATAALAFPPVALAADQANFPVLITVSSAAPSEDPAYFRGAIEAIASAAAACGADPARTWVLVRA